VLTIFSVPKPFAGEVGALQRTAIASWVALDPDVQVVLLGDEEGAAEAAAELGADYVPSVLRSPLGTPRVDDAFARVDTVARHRLRCFANADVVSGPDLPPAVARVSAAGVPFLLVGQTRDLPSALVDPDPAARRAVALAQGELRGPAAIDWFVFPAGLFDPIPPFLVGRAGYDNWLVWRARQRGVVVDATDAVAAVHQRHGYEHVDGGKDVAYYGAEAEWNVDLAGGRGRIFTLLDASHRLRADLTIRRNPAAFLRAGETMRKVKWKLGVR
jgi:hypothetical protein